MSRPRKNANPYPRGQRACSWCAVVKGMNSGQRYCTPRCAAMGRTLSRSDASWQALAHKASQAAARVRREAVLAKVAGLSPVDAYRYGYRLGQTAGYQSGCYRTARDLRRAQEGEA